MLSIGSMANGQGFYYTQLGREDYYLEGGEPPGYWAGKGADALKLCGQIDKKQFHQVFDGFSIDGKTKLVQNAGQKDRQPGIDLTFSAEKDVSVIWALADNETRARIEAVHRQAVETALGYLEREAAWTRTGQGGENVERAKLVFACFDHGTSRAQDPNLHTHCLALNVCVGEEGKTRAIRNHDLYLHMKTAGALYRVEMAHLLHKSLGFNIRTTQDGFYRIAGAPDDLRKAFSKRRNQIEAELEEKGFSTAAAAALANKTTRHKKGHICQEDLQKMWHDEARNLGYEPDKLMGLLRQRIGPELAPNLDKLVKQKAASLAKSQAWFRERELLGAVAEHCQGGRFTAEQIEKSVRDHLASKKVQDLGLRNEYREYTDKDYYKRTEQSLFALSDKLARKRTHSVRTETVKETCLRFGGRLNDEQRKAVEHLVSDPGGIKLLSGLAGTGKTTTLRVCNEIWQKDGYKVVGAALAGKAARELEEGAFIKSETLRKREMQIDPSLGARMWHHSVQLYRASRKWKTHRMDRIKLDSKTVLVIDEAGMLGALDTVTMLRKAHNAGAKVVLVGDERQLPAIEAVSAFKALQDRHGAAALTDIVRQREPWMREAVKLFAHGDSKSGLSLLNEHHRLHFGHGGREATMKALIEKWAESTPTSKDMEDSMILAGTRMDARRLNELAQETRKKRGELGPKGVRLGYGEDDLSAEPLKAYRGDRVMFLENDRKLGIYNGDCGTVRRAYAPIIGQDKLSIRLDSGKKVEVNLSKYDQLTLAYAATTHKAQGSTVERSFIYTNERDAAREMSYVQVSRHRGDLHVFMPGHARDEDLAELRRAMTQSKQRELATQRGIDENLKRQEEEKDLLLERERAR